MKESKKRMLVTAPDSMIRAFLKPHIEALINDGWEIDIACSDYIGGGDTLRNIFNENIKFYTVGLARSPFKVCRNLKGLREVNSRFRQLRRDMDTWSSDECSNTYSCERSTSARI